MKQVIENILMLANTVAGVPALKFEYPNCLAGRDQFDTAGN